MPGSCIDLMVPEALCHIGGATFSETGSLGVTSGSLGVTSFFGTLGVLVFPPVSEQSLSPQTLSLVAEPYCCDGVPALFVTASASGNNSIETAIAEVIKIVVRNKTVKIFLVIVGGKII